ncbi:octopamine receptor beta-1R-like [Dendronephthya gigantea]|uniref:octopamine receptor beta-1R-like n=1 Tax=Dendronephthya gigantea TaxID=151771 RepID=UPI00106A9BBC|nr:octopamine receptor beta-1R-like [Dendronephthya gigantea]
MTMNNYTHTINDGRDHEYFRSICFILMILSFIFLFVGVLGNAAVILYNICLNNERTLSSWLVTNLAIADLLVCLTIYPKTISRYFLREIAFDSVFNKLDQSTHYVSLFLSTTLLLSITVDRYVFIAKPLRYHYIVTWRRIKALLCVIWLTAAVQFPIVYTYCEREWRREKRSNTAVVPFRLSRIIILLVLIVVIGILNYKMLKIVQQQKKSIAVGNVVNSEQERPVEIQLEQPDPVQMQQKHTPAWLCQLLKQIKAVKTVAIIFGVLTICFVPYFVVFIIKSTCYSCSLDYKSNRILYHFALEVVGINSIANAFIYALRHRKYLRAHKKVLSASWKRVARR